VPAKPDVKPRTVAALTQQLENRISEGKRLHGVTFDCSSLKLAASDAPTNDRSEQEAAVLGAAPAMPQKRQPQVVQSAPQVVQPGPEPRGPLVAPVRAADVSVSGFDAFKMRSATPASQGCAPSLSVVATPVVSAVSSHGVDSAPLASAGGVNSGRDTTVFAATSHTSSVQPAKPSNDSVYCSYYSDATRTGGKKRRLESAVEADQQPAAKKQRHQYIQRIVDAVDQASSTLKAKFGCGKRRV